MAGLSFDAWTGEFELSEDTVSALGAQGFTSIRSCRHLDGGLIQKHFAKQLPLGQMLLLQEAVASLHGDKGDKVPPRDPPTQGSGGAEAQTGSTASGLTGRVPGAQAQPDGQGGALNMADLMDLLGSGRSSTQQPAAGKEPSVNTFDPFHTSPAPALSRKMRRITDFITAPLESKPKKSSFMLGDFEISVPESKPRLDSVTPMQCMEASLRILREMALEDGVTLEQALSMWVT